MPTRSQSSSRLSSFSSSTRPLPSCSVLRRVIQTTPDVPVDRDTNAVTIAGMAEAFVYDHLRTPRGKGKAAGSLHEVKPVDLVVGLIDELRERNPDLDTNLIDDVVLGVVSPIGDQGGDIAKTAALAAGLPETTAGVQLNRFCASGLEAVNQAASRVR